MTVRDGTCAAFIPGAPTVDFSANRPVALVLDPKRGNEFSLNKLKIGCQLGAISSYQDNEEVAGWPRSSYLATTRDLG